MIEKLGLKPQAIDHYIFAIPTRNLYDDNVEAFGRFFGVGADRLKFRSGSCGYCGGASVFVHFDQMVRSGELRQGQTALLAAVESSKWMSGGFVVRW